MPEPLDLSRLEAARNDIEVFAREILHRPLWGHQLEVARASSRVTSMLTGRQSGKTFMLSVLVVWWALRRPNQFVIIASAAEQSAKDVLRLCAELARVPIVEATVESETVLEVVFSNGSRIRAIPASENKARGPSVDLLVVDEAAFVPDGIHEALLGTTAARPEARIIYCSTPFGLKDRFFARQYRLGEAAAEGYSSFWWPSSVSPLVTDAVLAQLRQALPERVYQAEVEGVWLDDSSALFSAEVIEACVEDYELIPPSLAGGLVVPVGAVDWGRRVDASALTLLAKREDGRIWIPWLVEKYRMRYLDFIRTVIIPAARGFKIVRLAAETVGVGDAATESLREEFEKAKLSSKIVDVDTTNALKADAFNALSVLLERQEIALPRHPGLLHQLHAAEMGTTESGKATFGVPSSIGHDDLLVSLAFAALHFRGYAAADAKRARLLDIDIGASNRGFVRPSKWSDSGRLSPGGGL